MIEKSKIVLVDDHKLFRSGLRFILDQIHGIEVIAEADNGKQFLELLEDQIPDLVLMDINMPVLNGIEASRKALEQNPDLNILVLSMYSDEAYYNTMIDIGVKGFVLKDCDNTELENAIKRTLNGNTYFSQELLLKLIKKKHEKESIELTKREQEVLELICKGFSTTEIAEELFLSVRTVERHRSNLLLKTDSSNSIKLVLFAIKHDLVQLQ